MTSALDMTLDDLIKKNKKPSSSASRGSGGRGGGGGDRGGGGGGRGGGAAGPARRFLNRSANRAAPYFVPFSKAPDSPWKHDMYSDRIGAATVSASATAMVRSSAIETGTKLYISNLDYGVSNEDIKELFSEVGDLKRYSINYDRSGRSKGTAEVVFARRADAQAAVKRYNNVQLDGKPMKIEIIGTNIEAPPVPPPLPFASSAFRTLNASRSVPGRGGGGWSRGGGFGGGRIRGGRGGGGGGGGQSRRDKGGQLSAVDLDAELDKYHSTAMQTN